MEKYKFSKNCNNLFGYVTDIKTLNEYLRKFKNEFNNTYKILNN